MASFLFWLAQKRKGRAEFGEFHMKLHHRVRSRIDWYAVLIAHLINGKRNWLAVICEKLDGISDAKFISLRKNRIALAVAAFNNCADISSSKIDTVGT